MTAVETTYETATEYEITWWDCVTGEWCPIGEVWTTRAAALAAIAIAQAGDMESSGGSYVTRYRLTTRLVSTQVESF